MTILPGLCPQEKQAAATEEETNLGIRSDANSEKCSGLNRRGKKEERKSRNTFNRDREEEEEGRRGRNNTPSVLLQLQEKAEHESLPKSLDLLLLPARAATTALFLPGAELTTTRVSAANPKKANNF